MSHCVKKDFGLIPTRYLIMLVNGAVHGICYRHNKHGEFLNLYPSNSLLYLSVRNLNCAYRHVLIFCHPCILQEAENKTTVIFVLGVFSLFYPKYLCFFCLLHCIHCPSSLVHYINFSLPGTTGVERSKMGLLVNIKINALYKKVKIKPSKKLWYAGSF